MHVMVTIDHPWRQSFNFGILRTVVAALDAGGHTVDVLDLQREGFDPVLREAELAIYPQGGSLDPKVREYQARIMAAQHLVYIFPVWWEVMPALLKGFFDKVFLPEWAFAEADAAPLLTHISGATVITTMGAPRPIHTSVEAVVCHGILEFCGVRHTRWFNLCEVGLLTDEARCAWLDQIAAALRTLEQSP
jgi:NAD(P)H dehydrogenase (quinone)